MSQPGYVLDGIKTAMVEGGYGALAVACPCGWTAPIIDIYCTPDPHALRFHYTHCPQAKADER